MVVGVAEVSLLRQPVLDGFSRGATPSVAGHARWQHQHFHQHQQERTIAAPASSSVFPDAVAAVRFAKSSSSAVVASASGSAHLTYSDCSPPSEVRDFRRAAVKKISEGPISYSRSKSGLNYSNSEFQSTISNAWGFAPSRPMVSLPSWPIQAAVAETAGEGLKWWERGVAPNMLDVFTTQQFVDALQAAGERLVIVEFFASWCPSCRALFPKLCKIAAEHDDIVFLKVNIDDNRQMCKSLAVKVLPYFHIYRGASGRLDTFSCSLSKLQRLRDAITKHHDGPCEDCEPPEVIPEVLAALLEKRDDNQVPTAAASSD